MSEADKEEEFDIFRGMSGRDFTFRGCDNSGGATFEHTCGQVYRLGPDARISLIALTVSQHKCEDER